MTRKNSSIDKLSVKKRSTSTKSGKTSGVLLSIQDDYIEKIKNGKKQFEYRHNKMTRDCDLYFISSKGSKCQVDLLFTSSGIISESLEKLWEKTKDLSGWCDKDPFNQYFKKNRKQKKKGHAIKIDHVYNCKPFISKEILKNTATRKGKRKHLIVKPNSGYVYFNNLQEVLVKLKLKRLR